MTDHARALADALERIVAVTSATPAMDERQLGLSMGIIQERAEAALSTYRAAQAPSAEPLTDEQIDALAMDENGLPNSHLEFARAIERAHGIGAAKEQP